MDNTIKNVLVVCPYPKDTAPSQRLKYEQYFDYLNQHKFHFDIHPFVSPEFKKVVNLKGYFLTKLLYLVISYLNRFFILFTIRKYDIVYIHLWVTPIGVPLFEFLYCLFAKKVVYDIDDLIFLRSTKNTSNGMVNFLKGRMKPIYLMKNSNHVITCTPYLDSFVRKYNSNTTDISSTINLNNYFPKSTYQITNDQIIIGWSGSHSTSKYLLLLTNVFNELTRLGVNFKLVVMGDSNFNLPGVNFEAISWSAEKEVEVIRSFDIGVYPLPDTQWVLGKSSLKAIQYMSVGVPTIATAIGTNYRVIEDGVDGFLVNSEQEWIEAILKLYRNEELRREIGQHAILKVEKEFSVDANKDVYLKIMNGVLN